MRKGFYIIIVAFVVTIALGTCGKDESDVRTQTEDVRRLGFVENDSTGGGGITVTVDTVWDGNNYLYF